MKKLVLVFIVTLLLLTTAHAEDKKECHGRFGYTYADTSIIHKYVDLDCDGLWDLVLEFKETTDGWNFTGSSWDCLPEYRAMELTEIEIK